MSDYKRVIPRDLFNEAKLLKCLGQLCLAIEDSVHDKKVKYFHMDSVEGNGFHIRQDQSDGSFFCSNLVFEVEGYEEVHFFLQQNKDDPYPFFVSTIEDEETYRVFDDKGNLTPELAKMFGIQYRPVIDLGHEYAKVVWRWGDIEELGVWEDKNLTPDDAEEFLRQHERIIRDRMVETGWQVIEDLIATWEGPGPERNVDEPEKVPSRPGNGPS